MMQSLIAILAATLCQDDLAAAAKKTSELTSYAFKVEIKADGKGQKAPNYEGRFEKEKPLSLKVDGAEVFKKTGGVIVIKEGEAWKRLVKPPKGEKAARGEVSVQTIQGIKVPADELDGFEKCFEKSEKSADGELTLFAGTLTPEGARSLVSTGGKKEGKAAANLTYSGGAKVWVNKDGLVVKYEISVKSKGTVKEKEVEQSITRTVTISEPGATKVEIPEGAQKALDSQA
jgi:hypothetical protein